MMLIPKDTRQTGFVFEFKKVDLEDNESSETAMKSALKQIEDSQYALELRQAGVQKILGAGVVVHKKRCGLNQWRYQTKLFGSVSACNYEDL